MTPMRHYPFTNVHNFRDLGGYPTNNGRITAYNTFFRSDSPHLMSVEDQTKICSMGISTIVDLRFPAEQQAMPSPFLDNPQMEYHTVAIMSDFGTYNTRFHEGIPKLYIDFIQNNQAKVTEVFRELIQANQATWFYCRVGNVRTGIIAAMLLDSVGVAHNEIVADYMRSALYVAPIMQIMRQEGLKNVSQDFFDAAIWPRPENIRMMLYFLRQRYGGSAEYLHAAGITIDELNQLHTKFIIPITTPSLD
jgi:protein-tyrosine phosphatase